MIHFKNVSKVYSTGTKALDNVSMDFNKGDIIGIIGPTIRASSSL